MKVLSVNAGSSTLKFRLYEMPEEKVIMKGLIERIGSVDSKYSINIGNNKIKKEAVINNHGEAVQILLQELIENNIIASLDEIEAVGHRVVHGGSKYSNSVEITNEVMEEISNLSSLAPLHNPANLVGVEAFKEAIPTSTNVACFDTAFHQTMKEKEYLYSVPYEWYEKYGVRKYGFHGMSHKFITETMKETLNNNQPNLIICHIGNGASISAVKEGLCIDTSMGFTPNAGIMMGTRSGDIDYSIIDYISEKAGYSLKEINDMLNKKSGLEGIAGMNDLRDIDAGFEAGDEKVVLALNMYTDRIADYVAKYYIKLEGNVDGIIFTAGGGENDSIIRREVLNKLKPLGVEVDNKLNDETITRKGKEGIITTSSSKIKAYVIATDEELMIARDTYTIASEI